MATYTPAELMHLWKTEQLSPEMVTGHLLQNLVNQQGALDALNHTTLMLRADVDRLTIHAGLTPTEKGKRKPPTAH